MGKVWQVIQSNGQLFREPSHRRQLCIITAAILVCAYAGFVLAYVVLTPEIGIRCAFTPVVNQFYSEFLFDDEQPGLKPGDTVLQLGSRSIQSWPDLMRSQIDLKKEPGVPIDLDELSRLTAENAPPVSLLPDGRKIVRVVYQRAQEGGSEAVLCQVGSPPAESLLPSLLWFFLKIGLFAVGALVYWKRPADPYAGQFFLLCIFTLGAYIGGYHWSQIVTQPFLLVIFMVASMLLPAVSLHFYLVFPRPKAFLQRTPWTTLLCLYTLPLFFLLLILSGYLRVRWLYSGGLGGEAQSTLTLLLREVLVEIYLYFGVALVYYLACIVCLLHSYFRATDAMERNQVKWILYGVGASLVPIGYSFYLALVHKEHFASGGATWPMFAASVCVTAAFTISITRYRLMQLDKLISSSMIYFGSSFLAGLIYYGVVFTGMLLVGSRFSDGPSLGQVLTVSSTALVLLLVLDLARSRLTSTLNRHFRKEKHSLDRTLQRMRLAIDQLVDPPTLARRLLQSASELLGVARGAVYLRQGEPALYQLADLLGPKPSVAELPTGCPLVEALRTRGGLWLNPRTPAFDSATRQLQIIGAEVATGLVHEGQLLGLLVLGSRESGPYTLEDLNLLAAFAQLTALALVSAEGHRTIQTLNRELHTKVEKIAEQQRRILALQSQLLQGSQATGNEPLSSSRKGESETSYPPSAVNPAAYAPGVVGSSECLVDLLHLVRKVAASQSAVLLRGESGTGKEVLARVIHENSPRAAQPFIKVHCAALSAGLLESELFGHVKGAFTNAIRDKVGRFEAADGGTLFLDEIGDISLDVQTKLLRVLQEMTFERVGSSEPIQVDVRIIAATHQDLEELIRQGRFREDLFYRLNVFPIHVPPLREHVEDIPELSLHFLKVYGQRAGKELAGIDDDALAVLKGYSWPGNTRQLENVIERAVVIVEGATITLKDLPSELVVVQETLVQARLHAGENDRRSWLSAGTEGNAAPLSDLAGMIEAERSERERRERETLVRALASAGGNKSEAARALGIARSTLISRLKRLGLG